jgi:Ca2+-binding EF-hand superfamily protein
MELSEEELEALTLAFHMYDLDGSGAIDTYELKKALESMGQTPSDQDVLELMAAMDEDGSGSISFVEFMNMVRIRWHC